MDERVEVPAYTDTWMSGDRYGTVVRHIVRTHMTLVKLDKSGKSRRFISNDLRFIS